MTNNLLQQALDIANTADVSTLPNMAVVYSASYMPDDTNKQLAISFTKTHPGAKMLDDTPCGQGLISLGLTGKADEVGEEITHIWRVASSRYIKAASGNITAFVDDADERSTFCTTELNEILHNPQITHINDIPKTQFAATFTTKRY